MTQEALKLALDWFKCYADKSMSRNNAEALADEVVEAIEKALAEHAMSEVQRLGQEIEQEPVAWRTYTGRGYYIIDPTFEDAQKNWPDKQHQPLYAAPPQRKPLTGEQRKDVINKAWNKWLRDENDEHLFAWHLSFEVEAAHGIKENT